MKISVEKGRVEEKETALLALGIYEGEAAGGLARSVDAALGGAITDLIESGDFSGKLNQHTIIYPQGKIRARRLLLIGLGKRGDFDLESVRSAAGKVALEVRNLGLKSYTTALHGEGHNLNIRDLTRALVEGSELALYSYSRYKSDKDLIQKEVEEMTIFVENGDLVRDVEESARVAKTIADAIKLARDIANAPSSDMTPSALADVAKGIAERHSLKCAILERSDIERLGMGGLYNVSKGSQQPPKLIVLEYRRAGDRRPLVLVGKAVTFDSGGISIKPAKEMEEMKFDKSGGAAVLAAMQAVAELKLPLNVVAIIPAAENLPSGSAYKPGDIVRLYNSKTVEIISTDAEGRLMLADALAYAADNYKPEAIIDIATLTGACVIALGTNASGLFTNNRELGRKIVEAGEASGDRVWELPLWKDYQEQLKSDYADFKNTGGKPAGAITAAAFLSNFVGECPWAHLDIAGTAWVQEGSVSKTYVPKGATGVGVGLLTHLLMKWS